ncbi:MAG: YD repeat [Geobacteraceae bacterium]|nr:MAG: YD repeat [Geobacteraceae bacterium]
MNRWLNYSLRMSLGLLFVVSIAVFPANTYGQADNADFSEAEILALSVGGSESGSGVNPGFAGKPVSLVSGSETFKRTDLTLGNLFPISIERRYNSKSGYDSPMGYGWALNYDKRLYTYPDGSVVIRKETGWKRRFTPSGQGFATPVGETGILMVNSDGTHTYTEKDGARELYDVNGRLVSITNANGSSLVLSYEAATKSSLVGLLPWNIDQSTPLVVAHDYRLSLIEEKDPAGTSTGKWAAFQYNITTGRLIGLSDSLGRTVTYSFDAIGNLTGATTPMLVSSYGYTDPNNKHLLTSIDEGDGAYVDTYDTKGRVIRQTHGTGVIDIEYTVPAQKTKVTTTIKDSAGTLLNTNIRTVEFDSQGQPIKVTDTFGNETRYTRDARMNITREEHWENTGTVATPNLVLKTATNFTYDDKGNMLTKTEAAGTPIEKTTTNTYHPQFSKVLTETVKSVVDPNQNKVTTNAYDPKGNLTSTTETGLLGTGTPYGYTTTYEYDSNGRITKIDGPRTDVQDVATFTYDASGNRLTKTEPLIGTTTYGNYNSLGNPGTVTDPNGNTTIYTYDNVGRVLTIKAPGDTAVTEYAYTGGGCTSCGGATSRIDHIILPEGNRIDYGYDANGKQIKISDSLNNSINYSYDSEGNRLKEEIKDPSGALQKTVSYQYDSLNRLTKSLNPDSTYTQNSYDSLGNRISVKDPKGNSTTHAYDPLNRLSATLQPGNISTSFGYDTNNNQTSVSDANNNATSYSHDDKGRLYRTVSPDTGTTTYSYDPAGNLITKTDAKGITITYTYDALNRLTRITYPSDPAITCTYDTCPNGKGRLCAVADQSGSTNYEYTNKGQIAKKTRTIDGIAYVIQYSFDMNGNTRTTTYPSGRVITSNYSNDKVNSVLNNAANLASNISYKPYGGMSSITYGNGIVGSISYDNQYRVASITAGAVMNLGYADDANDNITGVTNSLDATKNKTFTYDALDRLTGGTGSWGTLAWTYDGVGNRLTEGSNSYIYAPNTDRLTSVGGKSFGYDNNGNIIAEDTRQYIYSQNQRLIQVADGAMSSAYTYNGNGQRVKKVVNSVTTIFHYSLGQLIAESNSVGAITAEYVYLNGQPLAKIEGTNIYYYHNDHLGTPQKMTDNTGAVVWSAEYKPFGEAIIDLSSTTMNNLRFPGQYFDEETGLNYNYFRNYNPMIGRYIEADPIGIKRGENHLFVYVQNNPINWIDPEGLARSRPNKPAKPGNSKPKGALDNLGEIPGFNLGDPDCVYRPINKCVKINCNKNASCPSKGPWFVKDIGTDCWCEEWKTVMECR